MTYLKNTSKLFGTITEVNAVQGIIKCDDFEEYGHVFIPSKADFKGRRCLSRYYRIGDHVSFYIKPSTHPEKGCRYIASGMKKIFSNKKLDTSQNDYKGVKGYITWITPTHGYIQLAGGGKAFFRNDDTIDSCKNLTVGFPYRSQTICDLERQTPQHGCSYRARNVKRYFAEQVNDVGSTAMVETLDDDDEADDEIVSPYGKNNCESEENMLSVTTKSVKNLTGFRSVGCQTDKLAEFQAIKEALGHEDVFQVLCQKCPNALKVFMQNGFK